MLVILQPYMRWILLGLCVALGISLGFATASGIGRTLAPQAEISSPVATAKPPSKKQPPIQDYETILRRNLFNSSAPGSLSHAPQTSGETGAARTSVKLNLLGTVDGGGNSLALIEAGKETELYRAGARLPDGGRIESIQRNQVRIQYPDGSSQTLSAEAAPLAESHPAAGAGTPGADNYQVKEIAPNSWAIPASEMERARENMSTLMKQARLEPHVVEGQTDGFMIRMIRPGTLLAQLGLKLGDIITSVNGVTLDSPEKGLQIFQQLREAKRLTVSLIREGNPVNFEYEVN